MLALLLALQQPVADSSPFRPLVQPAPTPVRGAAGAPGPRYWQQRADYTLEATLDTATPDAGAYHRLRLVRRAAADRAVGQAVLRAVQRAGHGQALDGVVDPDRFEAFSGTVSLPFPAGQHK